MTTDALKHSPESLFTIIANIIRCMLIHVPVTHALLICAIIPLIKDKNGKNDDSKLCEGHVVDNDLIFSTGTDPKKSKTMCKAFQDPQHEVLRVFYYWTVCVCILLSHISSPVIGRHSSLSNGSHWLTQYSLCTIQVYRVVRSSDHGDLSRKNPLTMQVCPMKKLVTLRRNSMRLTKRLMKLEEQN